MKGTRFFEVLSAVKKEDLKLLEEFILSPVYNKNKRVISSFGAVKNRIETNKLDDLSYSELAKAAFGNENTKSANFRVFLSDFTKVLEDFLVFISGNPYNELELVSLTRSYKLKKSFDKHFSDLYNKYVKKKFKDTFDYYALYALEAEKLLYTGNNKQVKQLDELVDLIYLSMKLDTVIRLELQGIKWSDTTGLIKKGYFRMEINKREHPFIYAKLLALKLVTGESNETGEMERFAERFDEEKEFYKYIADILLWFYRKEKEHKKEFSLLLKLDKKGVIVDIAPGYFLQMIDAGLAASELSNVFKIFNKYSKLLNSNNAISLSKAKIELYKHNYDLSLKELNKVNISDDYYYEQVSFIKQHIYKITGDKESFRYAIDAYRKWKKRG